MQAEVTQGPNFAHTTAAAIVCGEWNENTPRCRKMLQLLLLPQGKNDVTSFCQALKNIGSKFTPGSPQKFSFKPTRNLEFCFSPGWLSSPEKARAADFRVTKALTGCEKAMICTERTARSTSGPKGRNEIVRFMYALKPVPIFSILKNDKQPERG